MKTVKRIQSIKINRIDDLMADVSYIGEYSDTQENEFAIPTGLQGPRYKWFNPASVEPFDPDATWIPKDITDKRAYWHKAMQKNAQLDYERIQNFDAGNFYFFGVRAVAEVVIGETYQTIQSGGLWSIESDSEEAYIREIEQDELAALRSILSDLGFSKRAIAAAVKQAGL